MTDARSIAREIADEIERRGHFQDNGKRYPDSFDGCCVITSNAYWDRRHGGVTEEIEASNAFRDLLIEYIGAGGGLRSSRIQQWNDHTPTKKVLSTLRSL